VKVKRKAEITDAVRYERGKGLEDGFIYSEKAESPHALAVG